MKMKVRNLYEINSLTISELREHKFYLTDEEKEKHGLGKDADAYFYLTYAEIEVESILRGKMLKGEEKEKLRIELLRERLAIEQNFDTESVIKMYLDSDMVREQ